MRKPLIAANWKMNKTCSEALIFAQKLVSEFALYDKRDILIFPSYTALRCINNVLNNTLIKIGAQNFYPEKSGSFTGEISYLQLIDLECRYVLIGHSERRHIFNEGHEFINKKVRTAIDKGIAPILCVGETLDEMEAGKTRDILSMQINEALKGLNNTLGRYLTIAYEPVWAIGTGRVAQNEIIQENHAFIRGLIFDNFDGDTAENLRILYGGSVKPDNINEIMSQRDVDGVLVGGASLDYDSFKKLILFEE
jgi:triosephosphate isomerase